MLRRLAAVAFALVGLGIAFVIAGFLVIPGPVNGRSLLDSVVRASGSGGLADTGLSHSCTRAGPRWRCVVTGHGGSGSVVYEVKVGSLSCWKGRLVASNGQSMPKKIRGCVVLLRD